MNRKFPQTLAVLFGILAPFGQAFGITGVGIIYFLAGLVFGYLWPYKSWRWGLWIAAPLVAIIGLSVAFGGYVNSFLKNDLPALLLAVAAACLGSFITSFARKRQISSGSNY